MMEFKYKVSQGLKHSMIHVRTVTVLVRLPDIGEGKVLAAIGE